jgi:hypothetical protein
MHELDAPAAFAGIKQRLFGRPFATAYSTGIGVLGASLLMRYSTALGQPVQALVRLLLEGLKGGVHN